MPFLCRGKINNLLELFHTLPLSLGIAEPCKDAPAVPQHPPPVALPTPQCPLHSQAVTWLSTQRRWVCSTRPQLPPELHQTLPEECSCPTSCWAAGRNRSSLGICLDTAATQALQGKHTVGRLRGWGAGWGNVWGARMVGQLGSYRIIGWFGLEGTLKIIWGTSPPVCIYNLWQTISAGRGALQKGNSLF
uniref:Uncharacterized protein n=1 Tax=Ficedula albicollis TaxID=59894 RepID=A0A803VKK4_FICAL